MQVELTNRWKLVPKKWKRTPFMQNTLSLCVDKTKNKHASREREDHGQFHGDTGHLCSKSNSMKLLWVSVQSSKLALARRYQTRAGEDRLKETQKPLTLSKSKSSNVLKCLKQCSLVDPCWISFMSY